MSIEKKELQIDEIENSSDIEEIYSETIEEEVISEEEFDKLFENLEDECEVKCCMKNKKNRALIGAGIGALAIIGGALAISKKRKNK